MYIDYFYNVDGKAEMIDGPDFIPRYPDESPYEYPSQFPTDYGWWEWKQSQIEDSGDDSDDDSIGGSFDDDDLLPF